MPAKGASELVVSSFPDAMTNLDATPPDDHDGRSRPSVVAVVFAGGDPPTDADHAALVDAVELAGPERLVVIAADSGLHGAQDGGWSVDVVVGDLDSVDPRRLARAEQAGSRIVRHPAEKDATDLELAVEAAIAGGAEQIVVGGGAGGRLDHLLANVSLLAADRFAGVSMSARIGPAWIHIVRRHRGWTARRGDFVTLLPIHGEVRGVTTAGLLYPLEDAVLSSGSTLGVSNEHLGPRASVSIAGGVLAVVVPGEAGTHVARNDRAAPGAVERGHPGENRPPPIHREPGGSHVP